MNNWPFQFRIWAFQEFSLTHTDGSLQGPPKNMNFLRSEICWFVWLKLNLSPPAPFTFIEQSSKFTLVNFFFTFFNSFSFQLYMMTIFCCRLSCTDYKGMLKCTQQFKTLLEESLRPLRATGKEPRRFELWIPELRILVKTYFFGCCSDLRY